MTPRAALQADLVPASSVLLADLAHIGAIVASDGGTLSLTAAQLLGPQIDDGAGSAWRSSPAARSR